MLRFTIVQTETDCTVVDTHTNEPTVTGLTFFEAVREAGRQDVIHSLSETILAARVELLDARPGPYAVDAEDRIERAMGIAEDMGVTDDVLAIVNR